MRKTRATIGHVSENGPAAEQIARLPGRFLAGKRGLTSKRGPALPYFPTFVGSVGKIARFTRESM